MADTIDRQAAIDAVCAVCGNDCDKSEFVYDAPQDEQVIMCPEHYALSTLPTVQPELIECDPVLACNEATVDKVASAYQYLSVVRELEKCGYVLAIRKGERE